MSFIKNFASNIGENNDGYIMLLLKVDNGVD